MDLVPSDDDIPAPSTAAVADDDNARPGPAAITVRVGTSPRQQDNRSGTVTMPRDLRNGASALQTIFGNSCVFNGNIIVNVNSHS